jgi:hypothetical protein
LIAQSTYVGFEIPDGLLAITAKPLGLELPIGGPHPFCGQINKLTSFSLVSDKRLVCEGRPNVTVFQWPKLPAQATLPKVSASILLFQGAFISTKTNDLWHEVQLLALVVAFAVHRSFPPLEYNLLTLKPNWKTQTAERSTLS